MDTPEQSKQQIEALEDLRSIVKTMKALSAASIRQYEEAARSLADYYRTVKLGLQVVLRAGETPADSSPDRRHGTFGSVVFGSDHGLCGRFNEDIVEHALKRADELADPQVPRHFLSVGARAAAQLESNGIAVDENFWVPGSASRITATVQEILLALDVWQREAGVRDVYLFYNQAAAQGRYEAAELQLLPVQQASLRRLETRRWPSRRLPTFSMDREALLSALLRQYFFVSLFRACAESQASEHASRLAAMQSAEKNLDERLEAVTRQYRRVRQDAITSELLDVVAGFEATASGTDL